MIYRELLGNSAPQIVMVVYSVKAHVVFVDFDETIASRGVSSNYYL